MNKRQVVVATAAGIFTFGSAAAAIALNVGAASTSDSSPAGKLAATEQVGATSVTPSTIYVDVTVPDLPPVTTSSGARSSGSGSSGSTVGRSGTVGDHPDDQLHEDQDSERRERESHPGGDDDD